MKRVRHQGGFTLLEVLLALFIFSLSVVALVEAISKMGSASANARRLREVQSRLESLMTEFTRNPPVKERSAEGTIEKKLTEDGIEFLFRMKPAEMTNQDNQPVQGIYVVSGIARWTDGVRKDEISAETMIYPPMFNLNGPGLNAPAN